VGHFYTRTNTEAVERREELCFLFWANFNFAQKIKKVGVAPLQ
jgi:hypothetical protein